MKKILIGLIILLCIVLIVQLIYFNFTKKTNTSVLKENQNTLENDFSQSNEIYQEQNNQEEKIEVSGLDEIINKYDGKISTETIKDELIKFTDINMQKIYTMTSGKSNNKILQIYDLQTEDINEMNIYSGEDFLGITAQIFVVGNIQKVKCTNYSIDKESINFDDNGYTSFITILKFDSSKEIRLKVYLTNSEDIIPTLKFENVN